MLGRFLKGGDDLSVGHVCIEWQPFARDQLAEGHADEFRGLQPESSEDRFGFGFESRIQFDLDLFGFGHDDTFPSALPKTVRQSFLMGLHT